MRLCFSQAMKIAFDQAFYQTNTLKSGLRSRSCSMSVLLDGCPNSIICHYKGVCEVGEAYDIRTEGEVLGGIYRFSDTEGKVSKDCSIKFLYYGRINVCIWCILLEITYTQFNLLSVNSVCLETAPNHEEWCRSTLQRY